MISKIELKLVPGTPEGDLVVAIEADGLTFAEVKRKKYKFGIAIYPRPDGEPWEFTYELLIDFLHRAKKMAREET